MELLNTINWFGFMLQLGVFIVTVIGLTLSNRRAYERKFESKADGSRVDKIENKMEQCERESATVVYVDKQIRSVYHVIENETKSTDKKMDMLIAQQAEMNKNIKDILLLLPKN